MRTIKQLSHSTINAMHNHFPLLGNLVINNLTKCKFAGYICLL